MQTAVSCLDAFEKPPAERAQAVLNVDGAIKLEHEAGHTRWKDCRTVVTEACEAAPTSNVVGSNDVLKRRSTCLKLRLAGQTAGPAAAAVGAEVVRSIAQVVLTKAQAAGWGLLKDKVSELARCSEKDEDDKPLASPTFPVTCKVLATLSIKDLVSSPDVLLQAVMEDVFNQVKNPSLRREFQEAASVVGMIVADSAARWPQSGSSGVLQAIKQAILDEAARETALACTDAPTIPRKYAYVLATCLIQYEPKNIGRCDAKVMIDGCTADESERAELGRLWDLTTALFTTTSDGSPKPIDAVNLAFALGQDQLDVWKTQLPKEKEYEKERAQDYFDGTKNLVSGLVTKDWVSATSGGVLILQTLSVSTGQDIDGCDDDDAKCKTAKQTWDATRVLRLLTAVGNYALTFDKNKNTDPKEASEAREKIITELVDRMINRTDRTTGAVVSLGGSLGLIGGARFGKPDGMKTDFAFPVQLTLGVGLQTYHAKNGGFHMMLSALDLGQYVNFNDSLKVDEPEVKTAVSLGLTAGGWFSLRETPVFIAAHGAVSPFNTVNGSTTYQAGVVLGLYVPLLDFN
jgi:hypothetical protein